MNKIPQFFAIYLFILASTVSGAQLFIEDFEGMGGNLDGVNDWVPQPGDGAFKIQPLDSQVKGMSVVMYFDPEASSGDAAYQPYEASEDTHAIKNHYTTTSGIGDTNLLVSPGHQVQEGVRYTFSFDYFMRPDSLSGQTFTAELVDVGVGGKVLSTRSFNAPTLKDGVRRAQIVYVGRAEDVGKRIAIRITAPGESNFKVTGIDNISLMSDARAAYTATIPELSASPALLGAACFGWMLVRRRR